MEILQVPLVLPIGLVFEINTPECRTGKSSHWNLGGLAMASKTLERLSVFLACSLVEK